MSTIDQRTVLLASDDANLIRELSDRWQKERVVPAFVVAVDAQALHSNFDLAIVFPTAARTDASAVQDRVGTDALVCPAERSSATSWVPFSALLSEIEKTGRPVMALAKDPQTLELFRRDFPRVLAVAFHEAWPDTLVSFAIEVLRRIEAVNRAERAEQLNVILKRQATLGQYVIDMRHSLNNALTSVLGNAELLLLEPGAFSASVHAQLDTIRHMSLRMHEILHRFSSLEKELSFPESQTRETTPRQIASAAQ